MDCTINHGIQSIHQKDRSPPVSNPSMPSPRNSIDVARKLPHPLSIKPLTVFQTEDILFETSEASSAACCNDVQPKSVTAVLNSEVISASIPTASPIMEKIFSNPFLRSRTNWVKSAARVNPPNSSWNTVISLCKRLSEFCFSD